ncbi:MetQ/NlpA family ABC transporter substrate-binding protein [Bilophila sp.]|uniref:ABC transporter substrate-binding protein n=1 Tax=Bilophila sp. TaxID=1929485 RepID=UPI0030785335
MMRRLIVILSLLVLAAFQPAHSAPLKLGVLPAADTIVLHAAADEGLFAKQGLEVELIPFQSALELGAAMRAGALDGHFGDIINVLMQNESGSPQAIIATTSHSSPDNRCFGLVVSPKSKAQTLADLKGKDIAVSSATIIDFLLVQLLKQQGVAPDFLNRQDIRQIPVRLQMLLSGQIESALLPEPLVSLVEAKGARTILNASCGHCLETQRARRPRRRSGRGEIPRGPQGGGEAHQRKPRCLPPDHGGQGPAAQGRFRQLHDGAFRHGAHADRPAFGSGHQGVLGLDEG